MKKKLKNICAVVFDLDGVLVDTASVHSDSWIEVCKKYGLVYTNRCYELTKGRSRMQSLLSIISENYADGKFTNAELETICNEKNKIYIELLSVGNRTLLFEDAIIVLEELKKYGFKLGLASSSKNVYSILQKTGIKKYFDSIVTGNDTEKAKPFPDIYQLSIDKLGFQGENCIAIEDSYTGIVSASEAGLHTIYIGKDDRIINISEFNCHSVSELLYFLHKYNNILLGDQL